MDSHEVFERNLGTLRGTDDELVAALEAGSSSEIEWVTGPRGAVVLQEKGVLLGSAYDPVREAVQLAEKMAEEPADLMIALGFGLGEQFEPFLERTPCPVIVFEPSIPRLRAALERKSFVRLLASPEKFRIVTDMDLFSVLLEARYSPGLRMQAFTHPAVLRLEPGVVTRAVERIRRVKESADSRGFTSVHSMIPWAQIVAGNGCKIASRPGFGALKGEFKGRPAIVVAAGPSLDKQLPLLAEYQDRVLIVAIGQTVKALAAADVKPDLVHVLESQDVSHQLREAPNSAELNVALTPDCHPSIFDVEVASTFIATPQLSPMGTWIGKARGETEFTLGGGTVAQGAVGLAQMLGADPVLLIGQDLAFTEGRAYAKNSSYGFIGVDTSEDGLCRFTHQKEKMEKLSHEGAQQFDDLSPAREIVWVEGWEEGERVPTWPAYATFIEQYRDIGTVLAQSETRLINCTEGGARITGLDHRRFGDALAEFAKEPFEGRTRISDIFEQAETHEKKDFVDALDASRKAITRLETVARRASRYAAKHGAKRSSTRSDADSLAVLGRLQRFERKLKRQLTDLAWLDALVMPEIYKALVAFRRVERQDATVEHLLEETRFLFDALLTGVARSRIWFETFEQSFETESASKSESTGPNAFSSDGSVSSIADDRREDSGDALPAQSFAPSASP